MMPPRCSLIRSSSCVIGSHSGLAFLSHHTGAACEAAGSRSGVHLPVGLGIVVAAVAIAVVQAIRVHRVDMDCTARRIEDEIAHLDEERCGERATATRARTPAALGACVTVAERALAARASVTRDIAAAGARAVAR